MCTILATGAVIPGVARRATGGRLSEAYRSPREDQMLRSLPGATDDDRLIDPATPGDPPRLLPDRRRGPGGGPDGADVPERPPGHLALRAQRRALRGLAAEDRRQPGDQLSQVEEQGTPAAIRTRHLGAGSGITRSG